MKRILLILFCLLLLPALLWAGNFRLEQLEAAYLLNFIKYTTWEEQKENQSLQVYVFAPKVYDILMKMKDTVRNKSIVLHKVEKGKVSFSEADAIFISKHMVQYVPNREWRNVNPSALVVSDCPDILENKGVVEIYIVNNKLRFRINLRNLVGTRINSNLLRMATQVIQE